MTLKKTNRPGTPAGEPWHFKSVEETLSRFKTSPKGLSKTDAAQRLAADGKNEVTTARRISYLHILLAQFKSLVIWILLAAGVICYAVGEAGQALAIAAVVVLNAAIGFYQEFRAEKSIAALKSMAAPQAKVRRDGELISVPAPEVVKGDILILDTGDLIAADARLIEVASLSSIEAALTGESTSVSKSVATLSGGEIALGDRENLVFMGTSVAVGTGLAVVVSTGMQTELGRIAGLLQEAGAEESTPLQKHLDSFGRILVWAALGIVAVLFGLGLLRKAPLLELTMTSISLAVAAVPEGLPAVVTVALSLGVMRMARKRALVRKLSAVETLGSTSVICTDKTGTLTLGEMTVREMYVDGRSYEVTGQGYGPEGEVRFEGKKVDGDAASPPLELGAVLLGCNHAQLKKDKDRWTILGDPTEGALLAAGTKAGTDRVRLEAENPVVREFPFDSDRKRSSVVRRRPDGTLRAYVNGAPGILLERCNRRYTSNGIQVLETPNRERILAQTTSMAQRALRVLGSAFRDLDTTDVESLTLEAVESDLVFVGLSGMQDPPREEAKDSVAKCRAAGIRVVMITGDHPETALAIAREIGIAKEGDVVTTGVEMAALSDEELRQRAPKIAVYARVTAEHKLRIVRAWKANDATVAMTGDGVNDAPAIQGADIGIAMGRGGTEVTRQAADMIITDDRFSTIVDAVEEGRGIYDNITKTLQYLLAGGTGELLVMAVCVIGGLPAPLLPIHLLWINLVTDGLPALCLATDPIDSDVMQRKPRHRTEKITNSAFMRTLWLTGILTAAVTFGTYYYLLRSQTLEVARTGAFAVLVFAELLRAFGARSETKPVWKIPHLTNPRLALVIAAAFGLQIWSQHSAPFGQFLRTAPLPFSDCLPLIALGAVPSIVLEGVKVWRNRKRKTRVKT